MIRAIARKDLVSLWTSWLPYLVAILFNAVAGVLFVDQLAGRRQAVIQPLFPIAGFLLLVLLPILTMRSVAEEDRAGTLDVLAAVPVHPAVVVAGKWLAVVVTATIAMAPMALLPLFLSWWGDPDWGPVVSGFAGLALVITAVAAIGVLASSCTRSQAVAAVASSFAGLVLWFAGGRFSISDRLHSFAGGAIDTGDVVFFLALTIVPIVAAARCVQTRGR